MTIKLTPKNFSCYFFCHPKSNLLSGTDKKIALASTLLMGLTFGIGHLICAIAYMVKKPDMERLIAKINKLAQSTLPSAPKSESGSKMEQDVAKAKQIELLVANDGQDEDFVILKNLEKISWHYGQDKTNYSQAICRIIEKMDKGLIDTEDQNKIFNYFITSKHASTYEKKDYERQEGKPFTISLMTLFFKYAPDALIKKYFLERIALRHMQTLARTETGFTKGYQSEDAIFHWTLARQLTKKNIANDQFLIAITNLAKDETTALPLLIMLGALEYCGLENKAYKPDLQIKIEGLINILLEEIENLPFRDNIWAHFKKLGTSNYGNKLIAIHIQYRQCIKAVSTFYKKNPNVATKELESELKTLYELCPRKSRVTYFKNLLKIILTLPKLESMSDEEHRLLKKQQVEIFSHQFVINKEYFIFESLGKIAKKYNFYPLLTNEQRNLFDEFEKDRFRKWEV